MSRAHPIKVAAAKIVGPIVAFIYSRWSKSWTEDNSEMAKIDKLLEDGEGVIIVFWHGKYIPLISLLNGKKPIIFTSQSFRGEVISHLCHLFDYIPKYIPALKKNKRFDYVVNEMKGERLCVIAPDGPWGPNRRIKPGAVKLASKLGFLIVPISMTCSDMSVSRRRWDQQVYPHRGSHNTLIVGTPIRVPKDLTAEGVKEWSDVLKDGLNDLEPENDAIGW